jgi:hypothetical protein
MGFNLGGGLYRIEDWQLLACCFVKGNGKGNNPQAIAEPLNPKSVKS